jgi:hypothetical protein
VEEPDMNETGQDAREPFLEGSDDAPPGIALIRGVREQAAAPGRRWRRRPRVLVAAAVAVAAAGVTAALLVASSSDAPSPLAVVTGALAKTSAESYSFSVDSTTQLSGHELPSTVVSGAFDPRHELGTERLTRYMPKSSVRAQIRFIGQYVYTWVSPGSGMTAMARPWNKAPLPPAGAAAMPAVGLYGFVTDRPVSPAELSGVLRSASTVRDGGPASGPGWTGAKYAFTAHFSESRESITVSGTVYVDQHGCVRRLVTITTQRRFTMRRDLTFSDFGAAVPVTAPAVSQVEYTSEPYWGFFF